MTIRVLVNGAKGRMGSEAVKAVEADPELTLAGAADQGDDLPRAIAQAQAQVVVDFTTPQAAFPNAQAIVLAGARPVIGTTGFSEAEIARLEAMTAERGLGGVIAPNFAIGAVLMMRFAAEAARHLPHVEIIEIHHDHKADAPSGTAVKTAQLISQARGRAPAPKVNETELNPGARGTKDTGVPIHSVRLPGHVAHQMVVFGGTGESLTLRHDTIHRECFMPGVVLACKKVMTLDRLVYGLERLLF
ncbi:MAG: 4-hydroxy-tetrahydrodipicolinate reductase [Deltaproteobacteria bacterium]|nr:4-hydroxy-tetrahydrodipicolinate reductase [Deltaproteobacteria bacterium]